MKKIIFLFLIFSCLVFCGCSATGDMECGIDGENNAYICLRVNVNAGDINEPGKERIKSALQDMAKHYRDTLGFEYDYDYFTDKNTAAVTFTKTEPADSFEEAFENLKAMLCDEAVTPFSTLNCELSDTKGEYAYRINGSVDLHRVIENTYNSGISKGVSDYVREQLEKCSFSVTLSMPDNARVYRLSLDEPTEISHQGEVSCFKGSALSETAVRLRGKLFPVLLIVLGVLSLILLAGMIAGISLIKKEKKKEYALNGEIFNDQEEDKSSL